MIIWWYIDYLIFKKSPFEEIKMAELVEQIEAKIKIRKTTDLVQQR